MTVLSHAVDERRDLLAFLRGLEPYEWESPTLCSEWRVRDLVAHIASYGGLTPGALARRLVKGRVSLSGANRVGVEQLQQRTPSELIAQAGGDTDLNDTIPLCQPHHTLVTSGGWSVRLDLATGSCIWTAPDGRTIVVPP